MEKRHTCCRSFETLEADVDKRPKSTIISNTIDFTKSELAANPSTKKKACQKLDIPKCPEDHKNKNQSVMIENAGYTTQDALETIIIENPEYVPSGGLEESVIVDNAEYSMIPVEYEACMQMSDSPNADKNPSANPQINILDGDDEYYAVSPITEAERKLLRKNSEQNYHIYERISGESRFSYNPGDPAEYAASCKASRPFLKAPSNSEDNISVESDIYNIAIDDSGPEVVLIENDEYCTPEMVVGDTELVSYHEYNVGDKDRHIYSVPNFDHNENRISRDQNQQDDLNPYSVCQLYPKSKMARDSTASKDEDALYDDPMNYVLIPSQQDEHSKHLSKLLRKLKKLGNSNQEIHEKKQQSPTTKKSSFLQKIFKRNPTKKKEPEPEEVVEEIEYAQIDEDAVKKMDMAYCIDKKLLTELQMILQMKKRKLKEILDTSKDANKSNDDPKDDVETKPRHSSDTVTRPKVPAKPPKTKTVKIQDDSYQNLKTIDEILNDLEDMKRSSTLTSGRVRNLIEKFDDAIKKKGVPSDRSPNDTCDVVLRPKADKIPDKTQENSHNSTDELNRLLSELAKVTYAPILTPGVTSSLEMTSHTQDEEVNGMHLRNKKKGNKISLAPYIN
ncbi:hypothetical protein AMK59_6047 [Oryctes borbonicus]|uniref:Uncharacterized protein n=1 Tax=Oryctes borbonicus TaxID=1629725 RepID=A0A0T6B1W2_9SCAR|nr:hypothetical protein AMK59_6047 [Oryctes borbonicus]